MLNGSPFVKERRQNVWTGMWIDVVLGICGGSLLFVSIFFFSFLFWLHWVFVAARGLSLVAVSGGHSSLWCGGFSLRWLLLLWSTGSRHSGFSSRSTRASVVVALGSVVVALGFQSAVSVVVVHGLSCSAACGIFPDQGLNPCPLHCQADH